MATFPIVDLSDELNQARVHALADALGMQRDAFVGYLIDAAVRRLTTEWVDHGDADHEDYAVESAYARGLDVLADALSMARDDDAANLIWEAARRLAVGQIIPVDEAINLPTGSVLIRVDPATGDPFPLDHPGGAPFRVGETGASLEVGEHVAYRVLLRGTDDGEPGHQPGDVVTGEQVPELPAGVRYCQADAHGDPSAYAVVLEAREGYIPGIIEADDSYVIVYVPGGAA